jgi:hypothetical protein
MDIALSAVAADRPDHLEPDRYRAHRDVVANRLLEVLATVPGGSFLEIGVGPRLKVDRFQRMRELGIRYTGLDFEEVCIARRADLRAAGLDEGAIRFLGNRCGTYLFNLVRLGRAGERFDVVYLDGSHSLNTDFPAAVAAIRLLKPGALFLFDDLRFTFATKHLIPSTERYVDDGVAEGYDGIEAAEAHIRIIVEEYMIPVFGFRTVAQWSDCDWVALRAPVGPHSRARRALRARAPP